MSEPDAQSKLREAPTSSRSDSKSKLCSCYRLRNLVPFHWCVLAGRQWLYTAKIDYARNAILKQRDAAGALAGSCSKQVTARSHIKHVRHCNAHVTIAFATNHHNDLGFIITLRRRIALSRNQHSTRIFYWHQLTFEIENWAVADVLDA